VLNTLKDLFADSHVRAVVVILPPEVVVILPPDRVPYGFSQCRWQTSNCCFEMSFMQIHTNKKEDECQPKRLSLTILDLALAAGAFLLHSVSDRQLWPCSQVWLFLWPTGRWCRNIPWGGGECRRAALGAAVQGCWADTIQVGAEPHMVYKCLFGMCRRSNAPMQCYAARIASCLPRQSVLNFHAKAIIAVFATTIICWAYGLLLSLW
jgi:hypothetical protein